MKHLDVDQISLAVESTAQGHSLQYNWFTFNRNVNTLNRLEVVREIVQLEGYCKKHGTSEVVNFEDWEKLNHEQRYELYKVENVRATSLEWCVNRVTELERKLQCS